MAADETTPTVTTSQVTTNFSGPPTVADQPSADTLYPRQGPDPTGTHPGAVSQMEAETPADPNKGAGIEGEEVVWEARYAMKNFLGRLIARALLTVAWIALAVYTWGYSDGSLALLTGITGVVLLVLWLALIYRIIQARFGHYYRLTTRRLFVSTGLMRRRRDMMELLRVKDVFTRQTLVERWLSLGTVVVVSSDRELPTFYVAGVDDPKRVMDLIWHHARAERDRRSVKVEQV
jgi:membrane protein YdbS with pleckstrin-like domain